MRANKGKDTKPELAVRRGLHALGYRFRLHRKGLPGRPDLAFPSRRAAIEVRGCYWHGHGCRLGQPSKTRTGYWGPKIEANKARDARNVRAMEEAGWRVMEVWECELRRDPAAVLAAAQAFLGPPLRAARDDAAPGRPASHASGPAGPGSVVPVLRSDGVGPRA